MVPSEWVVLPGTVWQFEQASGLESAGAVLPWFTCARCTPATPVADATDGRRRRDVPVGSGHRHPCRVTVAGGASGGGEQGDGAVDVGGEAPHR